MTIGIIPEFLSDLKENAEKATPGRLPMLERLPAVNSNNISEFIGVLLRNHEKLIQSNSQLIYDNMHLIGLVEHLEKEVAWREAARKAVKEEKLDRENKNDR